MARVVIDDACDACWRSSKTARVSDIEFTLDGKTWFLCAEHERKLAQELSKTLGDTSEGE